MGGSSAGSSLLADIVGLTAAFALIEIGFGTGWGSLNRLGFTNELVLFLVALPIWVVLAKWYGLYDRDEERNDHSTADDFRSVVHLLTLGIWTMFAFSIVLHVRPPDGLRVVAFWLVAIICVVLARWGARVAARQSISYLQNTVIVGAGDVGQSIARRILNHPEYGLNLVGFLDDAPKDRRADLEDLTLIGGLADLEPAIDLYDVERVIVAFSNDRHEETLDIVRLIRDRDVQVDIVPRLFDVIGPNVGLHFVEGVPLVGLPPATLSRSARLAKRTLDGVVATAALIILSPLLALIAAAIKLTSSGPVIFKQERMGQRGNSFMIWKFRTMVSDAEEQKDLVAHLNQHAKPGGDPRMFKIPDDPRVTRVGRWLRRYCLDELPQLVNVLKGEMSIIGPRPLILAEARQVDSWAQKRLDLKPGITGPWQVQGRSRIPFQDMLRLDYLYVTSWSFAGDLKLALQTLPVVLHARDPY